MLCVPQPFIRFIRAVSAGKDLNPAASRGSALQKWPHTQKGPNSNQKKSYCPKPLFGSGETNLQVSGVRSHT